MISWLVQSTASARWTKAGQVIRASCLQLPAQSWRGVIYYVAIGSLLAVLCLSANTSFVGFPSLCRLVARDGYLPAGGLVYSVGILWLAATAGLLLTVFGGITDRLIPLFAVGAFMAFTLSQLGMAFHWAREQAIGGVFGSTGPVRRGRALRSQSSYRRSSSKAPGSPYW